MPNFEILKTSEFSELTPGGQVKKKMRVMWRVDETNGPYVDVFDAQPFDVEGAKRTLEERASSIKRLAGR